MTPAPGEWTKALLSDDEHAGQAQSDPAMFTDDTLVEFEGETVRWGNLMLQDRKAYLCGGYAF